MNPVALLVVALAAPPDVKPLARLGDTRLRHAGTITSLAFAPDGKTLVAHAAKERAARVWDVATGRELRKLAEPRFTRDVTRVVGFTPDGTRILILNDDEECVVLRAADGEELARFGAKTVVAISPDGTHAAGVGVHDEVKAWALADGTPKFALGGFGDADKVVAAFSPDGKRVAVTGGAQPISIRRMSDGEPDHAAAGTEKASSLVWSAGGSLYAIVGTDYVRVADKPGAAGERALTGFRAVALPADGRHTYLIGAATARVRCFAPNLKGQIDGFDGPTVPTDGRVAVSANGAVFAVSDGPLVRVYDGATGGPHTVGVTTGTAVDHLTSSADGSRLLAVGEQSAVLWDVVAGKPLHAWTPDGGRFTRGALSPDGRFAVALRNHNDARAVVWDARTGAKVFQEPHEPGNAKGVSFLIGFDPAGRLWVGDQHGPEVRVIELPSGAVRRRIKSFADCWDGALTPDGRTLMVSGWEVIATRPTADDGSDWAVHGKFGGTRPGWWPRPGEPLPIPLRPTLSPSGRFAVGGMGQDILAWDVARPGKRLRFAEAMPKSIDFVGGLQFTSDSRRMAWTKGVDDQSVRFWEVGTWAEQYRFAPADRVRAFALSADGKRLAVAHPDGTLSVWDMAQVEAGFFEPPVLPDEGDLWEPLGSPDPAVGLAAVRQLAGRPAGAVKLFAARFSNADKDAVATLVADLDSPVYAVRSKATRTLSGIGEPAEGAVRRALEMTASAEVRERAALVLRQFETKGGRLPPALARGFRAVEVLERIGTPEAAALLTTWAGGEPSALRTQEAAAAVVRLSRK